MVHFCSQETAIALLKKDNDNMSRNINEIKKDVSDIKWDMSEIKEFILTSPQKFAEKDEFDKFKNSLNIKVAGASWWFAVIIFILNKFF